MNARVDGSPRDFRRGAALAALLTEEERAEVAAGRVVILDGWGHVVDAAGAVADDGDYVTVRRGARPASVGASLELVEPRSLPAPLAKALVRRAIAAARLAGGAASAAGAAALAAAFVVRRDEKALWEYVAGEGEAVAAYPGGAFRLAAFLPAVKRAVVASRDCLTFASGADVFTYLEGIVALEVGTTNKVNLGDYEKRFGDADAVIACRRADFDIFGFTATPALTELAAAARRTGLPFVAFIGGYGLIAASGEPAAIDADIVVYSGPAEAPDADVVFYDGPLIPVKRDAASRGKVAETLWRRLLNVD